jgi:alanyl-tRNA synthetase
MFEMLGNWSFGLFIKRSLALGLGILDSLKLDKDRLYVSVFEEMKGECSFDQKLLIWKQFVPKIA